MIQMPDIQAIKVMIKAVLMANLAIIMGNPTIGNTRVSVAYYYFYDNIQLYEPIGKGLYPQVMCKFQCLHEDVKFKLQHICYV